MSALSIENVTRARYATKRPHVDVWSKNATLEISQSRVYDYALNVLNAYKLSGNFTADLEIVLKDLGLFDEVSFTIKPKPFLSDCRHVEFLPKTEVQRARFRQIVHAIESCVGYEPASSVWTRLFQAARYRRQAVKQS
jgi:hypothetical protein